MSSDEADFDLTEEQQRALDLDRNIAITAGAGTGKTTTLEERYRHILTERPDVDPTDVVTITFTRDATAELRNGIRDVIDEQLTRAGPGDYARWRRAKDAVEDAYIHTIHGFCSRILHEYAVEADLHPDVDTLDEQDADILVTTLAREIIIAALEEGGTAETVPLSEEELATIEPDIRRLARLYDREELVSLVSGLIAERPESDRWADELAHKDEATYVEEAFARAAPVDAEEADALAAREAVQDAVATIEDLAGLAYDFTADDDDGRATLKRINALLPEEGLEDCSIRDRQELFLVICQEVTSNDGDLYSRSHYYAGSATRWGKHGLDAEHEAFQGACQTLIDALEPERRSLDVNMNAIAASTSYVFAIARLYRTVRKAYEERKRTRNALDYSDLIERTVRFLETNDAARQELRDQFDFIMIDEVQDTDPRQWDLVALLSGTDAPGFDGQNVFVVGDAKQSIYRFRRADVTMVRRTEEQLTMANPAGVAPDDELSGNFRTLAEPLDFLNDLFDRVFEPEDPVEGYAPFEAEPQDLDAKRPKGTDLTGTVEYLVTPEEDEDLAQLGMEETWFDERTFATRADREAQSVAARLTRLFDEGLEVYDTETEEYRSAEPSDVALLFRARTRVRAFERAFEEHDIPYTSSGGQSLYDTPEIRPLVNLLTVLQQPQRDVPLYGVLRSPLFGFPDEELATLYDPDRSLWAALQSANGRLGEARDRLEAWREQCGVGEDTNATKWGTFVSQVIDETGYLVGIGADERPTQAIVNVNQFRETLRDWEEGSALPLADVLTRIEHERTFGDTVEEGEIPSGEEGVQLRTVHSSKGLEFPIVIVPELGRETGGGPTISHDFGGGRSTGLAYLEEIDDEPVLGIRAPDPSNPVTTTKTPDWQLAEAIQDAEERAEAKRVLYVATTRARDHLILSSTHRFDDEEADFGSFAVGADADCWRDWVQPVLLEDRELLPELRTDGVSTSELPNSTYLVRQPPEPVAGPGEREDADVAYDIEIPEPEKSPEKRAMAATAFRDLVAKPVVEVEVAGDVERPFFADLSTTQELSGTEFGDLVHRLCELQLSGVSIDWEETPHRVVDNPERLTTELLEDVRTHVEAGVAAVETLERDLDVIATANERQVILEVDKGEVVGDIDHLTQTPTRYYITDYKTDSVTGSELDTLAEEYWIQLKVYACALQQAEAKEEVVARLVFTSESEVRTKRFTSNELDEYIQEVDRVLEEY